MVCPGQKQTGIFNVVLDREVIGQTDGGIVSTGIRIGRNDKKRGRKGREFRKWQEKKMKASVRLLSGNDMHFSVQLMGAGKGGEAK